MEKSKKQKLTPKQTLIQIAKFVAFSMGAGIIQLGSYALFTELTGADHWKCYLPSLILSVLYNFTVNRRYTFKSANNVPVAMLKVAFYYCIFTPISTYLGDLAVKNGINNYVVEISVMLCNMITEFLVCRFWVYRNSINTNKLAQNSEEAESKKQAEDSVQ